MTRRKDMFPNAGPGANAPGPALRSSLRSLRIEEFNYPLPEERIALYPLPERDRSKLLVYRTDDMPDEQHDPDISKKITCSSFRQIGDFLPRPAMLIFNNTRVVRARLLFFKEPPTGQKLSVPPAQIEIFCLEPTMPADIASAFYAQKRCRFKCLIGNNKRWKEGELRMSFPLPEPERTTDPNNEIQTGKKYTVPTGELRAKKTDTLEEAFEVEFSWTPADLSFAEVLEQAGKVPLPPYIRRQAEASDIERYQTVFARYNGSVAAPTAGLHFTPEILRHLPELGIEREFITLHVGAGTFKPVKAEQIGNHSMHREHLSVSRSFIENLLQTVCENKPVIPVGTTSMRSLESLYWIGVRLVQDPQLRTEEFEVDQWDPYETFAQAQDKISPQAALEAILVYMQQHKSEELHGHTALMIAPGYRFAFCGGIVTNFHQPQSTLLLLISALTGPDWRKIYDYALKNDFRFLSYGDSCLFLKAFSTRTSGSRTEPDPEFSLRKENGTDRSEMQTI